MSTEMKSLSLLLSCFLALIIFPIASIAQDADEDALRIDRNHSTIGFTVPIAGGISKVTGKFTDFTVDIVWDDNDPSNSSVSVEIQVASVSTGYEGRDSDVTSEGILDAESYPTITFESHDIRRNGTGFVAVGDFTLHGVTKEIYLPINVATVTDPGNPDDPLRAFQISYRLNRSDYGIDWKHRSIDFFFGFDIDIDIAILLR